MSSPVAELEAGLQAMLALKAPGVTGSRIASLTSLCSANIQSESVLIQKLYTHFKKAPGTHKLGVLYVVDAVVRKWTELARSSGQDTGTSASDGTYGAGVNRIRELLPVLMNDIISSAPKAQQEKITKLIEIWEKGQTFPPEMLKSFKEKLLSKAPRSTTPEGSPPPEMRSLFANAKKSPAQTPAPVAQNTSSILEALANMARQNSTTADPVLSIPATAHMPPTNGHNITSSMPDGAQNNASLNPYLSQSRAVNVPALPGIGFGSQLQSNSHQTLPSNQPLSGIVPPVIPPVALTPDIQRQLLIAKTLADAGVPQAQWAGIIASLSSTSPPGHGHVANAALPPPQPHFEAALNHQPSWIPSTTDSRDQYGYGQSEGVRLHHDGATVRSRSRSPPPNRGWRRNSPTYDRREDGFQTERSRISPEYGRGRDDNNARGRRDDYRERSPMRNGHSPPAPKWMQFDSAVPQDHIRVLSRTLFVGGVSCGEAELRRVFAKFGKVQTCVVNKEKRHAFVKMVSRKDAVLAKEGMERMKGSESRVRSTRWGVGFGPRECSDYHSGVSIIPIDKLTDADRKWLLTAEYGGTGGKPIQSQMVVEEPDIEVGQGVSSKAISRRIGPDKGGDNGARSGRDHREDDRHHDRRRDNGRREQHYQEPSAMNTSNVPPMHGFPYPMPPAANGLPMFSPAFGATNHVGQYPPPHSRG